MLKFSFDFHTHYYGFMECFQAFIMEVKFIKMHTGQQKFVMRYELMTVGSFAKVLMKFIV